MTFSITDEFATIAYVLGYLTKVCLSTCWVFLSRSRWEHPTGEGYPQHIKNRGTVYSYKLYAY